MDFKYDAFISYRHCEIDKYVATNLHRKLEKFKLPKSALALLPDKKKSKIERVFRDEEELPLASELSNPIDKALENSDFLIVICTPRLKESRWCLKEIETFMKMHGRERILLVLAEGEPADSFPDILTYEETETVDGDGNIVIERKPKEPLAADVRGDNNRQILKAMDTAVIKLAAAMFGLNYDDVKQRHREQKLKRRVRILSLAGGVVTVFACVCLVMLAKINAQKNELQDKYAASQAIAADELLGSGRRKEAVYAASSVLPKSGKYNSEAYRMLIRALSPYSTGKSYIPSKTFEVNSAVDDYFVSGDGKYIAIFAGTELSLFNCETEELISVFEFGEFINTFPKCAFDGDNGLMYCNGGEIRYYEISSGNDEVIAEGDGAILCESGSDTVVVISEESIYGYRNGERLYDEDISDFGSDILSKLATNYGYSDDGSVLTIAANNFGGSTEFLSFETESGKIITEFSENFQSEVFVTSDVFMIYAITSSQDDGQSSLALLDSHTGEYYGSVALPVDFIKEVKMVNGNLFIRTTDSAVIMNISDFRQIGRVDDCNTTVDAFVEEGIPYVADRNGEIYTLGEDAPYGMILTHSWFDILPKESVIGVKAASGKYFYAFSNADYVSLYEDNTNTLAVAMDSESYTAQEEFEAGMDATEDISNIDDIRAQYVNSALWSSDGSKLLLSMQDGSFRIYDRNNYKLTKVLYDMSNSSVSTFVYLEKEDIYVVTTGMYSYILDGDLNYIANIGTVVGFENGNFIINDTGILYEVPYIGYEDMVKMAEDVLGNYKPNEEIAEKYNMQY